MKFILDTNILISMVKNSQFNHYFEEKYFQNGENIFSICFVTLGELDSFIKQNQWGAKKMKMLNNLIQKVRVVFLDNHEFIECYGTIDAYSQGKLNVNPLPNGVSARNMGKNDIWIGAVTMSLNGTLITTDKDFDHLHNKFIQVSWIDITTFKN